MNSSLSGDLVFKGIEAVKVPSFPTYLMAKPPSAAVAAARNREYGRYCSLEKDIQKQQLSENISADPLFRLLDRCNA